MTRRETSFVTDGDLIIVRALLSGPRAMTRGRFVLDVKSTWDALCNGKYEWAHLAMHLWPERVVPECAKDRSFAIAHGKAALKNLLEAPSALGVAKKAKKGKANA